ncbi:MAG: hypothetical protein HKM86_01255, partial [Deltaproteobacteria bacterium]|nr:hypothetical protein [Deltaproteobacteria bacterium]
MKIHPFFPLLLLLASAVPAFSDPGGVPPAREITMTDCVEAALRGNIDVAVSRSEREAADLAVPMEEAVFLPRFTGDLSYSRSIGPTGSSIAGTLTIDQSAWNFEAGVKELLRSGTTLSLSFENQRLDAGT